MPAEAGTAPRGMVTDQLQAGARGWWCWAAAAWAPGDAASPARQPDAGPPLPPATVVPPPSPLLLHMVYSPMLCSPAAAACVRAARWRRQMQQLGRLSRRSWTRGLGLSLARTTSRPHPPDHPHQDAAHPPPPFHQHFVVKGGTIILLRQGDMASCCGLSAFRRGGGKKLGQVKGHGAGKAVVGRPWRWGAGVGVWPPRKHHSGWSAVAVNVHIVWHVSGSRTVATTSAPPKYPLLTSRPTHGHACDEQRRTLSSLGVHPRGVPLDE
ncbi:hypothetical protein GWK47_024067 [Chionoecetes opilio]|uniref:Uncharacterized protein n=1 Tax=Chionoecetes opilio TaxID=41210 RepID=A0A8J4XLB0_CHIOP|nr:hypothetical protein GWK47_024067 [Chionoecetes opilio]